MEIAGDSGKGPVPVPFSAGRVRRGHGNRLCRLRAGGDPAPWHSRRTAPYRTAAARPEPDARPESSRAPAGRSAPRGAGG